MREKGGETGTKPNLMDAILKKELLTHLDTGHGHESMTDMAKCNHCGQKFKKGEALWHRLRKEKPELFAYQKPEFKPSEKTKGLFGQLVDRIKRDKLYKRHLKRMAWGTEEEKDEEIKLFNKGYYRSHYEREGNILTKQ